MDPVKRGEVWLVRLDPTVGSEIRKTRPCLIVSPDDLNGRAHTLLIAPLTSGSRLTRFRVATTFLDKPGLILPDQLRVVDRQRLIKPLGAVGDAALGATLQILREMFTT